MITGNSSHEWAIACADLNVQGYVIKPVDAEALLERIRQLLGMEKFAAMREFWGSEFEAKIEGVSPVMLSVLTYISENYSSVTRKDVACYLDMSPQYISRKFYKECGIHLTDYIYFYKIYKAKEQLKKSTCKVSAIMQTVGISDQTYFYRLFKRYTGSTPTQYRNSPWETHIAPPRYFK